MTAGAQDWADTIMNSLDTTTLHEILTVMGMVDEGEISLTIDQMKQLSARVKEKADSYQHVHEDLTTNLNRLQMRIKTWQSEEKRIARDIRNLEKLLLWNMQSNDLEILPGEDYIVKRKKNPAKVVPLAKCTAQMAIKYPDLVRTKYKWAKTKVKKRLKSEPDTSDLRKLFVLAQEENIKFEVNKGKLYAK